MSPGDLEAIRAAIREEIEPMRSEMRAGFDRVWAEFASLHEELQGVIDPTFKALTKDPREGGPAGGGMAAKGR